MASQTSNIDSKICKWDDFVPLITSQNPHPLVKITLNTNQIINAKIYEVFHRKTKQEKPELHDAIWCNTKDSNLSIRMTEIKEIELIDENKLTDFTEGFLDKVEYSAILNQHKQATTPLCEIHYFLLNGSNAGYSFLPGVQEKKEKEKD